MISRRLHVLKYEPACMHSVSLLPCIYAQSLLAYIFFLSVLAPFPFSWSSFLDKFFLVVCRTATRLQKRSSSVMVNMVGKKRLEREREADTGEYRGSKKLEGEDDKWVRG